MCAIVCYFLGELVMRENLKQLIGEEISGVAKCVRNGHRCLLRDIVVDDSCSFDPDLYLAIEQHLWTDSNVIEKNNIKRYSYFRFAGSVYEYKRENDTTDYSIELKEVEPIDTFKYLKSRIQQCYCRHVCLFFEHCYYNCCAPQSEKDNFVIPVLEKMFLEEAVNDFAEEYEFSPKDFLKEIRNKTLFKISDAHIYLGMNKADFIKRYKSNIIEGNEFGYKMKPIEVDKIFLTPVIHFMKNGMCDAIAFETNQDNLNTAIQYINKKYNTNVTLFNHKELIDLFKAEMEFGDIIFGYSKAQENHPASIVMSLSTPISTYFSVGLQ